MNSDLQYLLMLAGRGVRGEAADVPGVPVNYHQLLLQAGELEIAPCCIWALRKNRALRDSMEDFQSKEENVKKIAMGQAYGREKLFGFLDRMKSAGFSYAVMKGCAIAECYGEPFLRVSSDTDLLIDEKQEKELYRWLEEQDFEIEKRAGFEYHSVARHKEFGLFELHVSLSDVRMVDYWTRKSGLSVFRTLQRPPVLIEGKQGCFYSLEYTEQMLFVTLHFVRHFVRMDGTFRMVLDNCAYASYYREKIDWAYYWDVLRKLEYEKLMKSVFLAADRYAGFHLEFDNDPEADEESLESLLEILCSPEENCRIMNCFKDFYRAQEMGTEGNSLVHRLKILLDTAPHAFSYAKKNGFRGACRQAAGKINRILFSREEENSRESAQWLEQRRKVFHKLGLMSGGQE